MSKKKKRKTKKQKQKAQAHKKEYIENLSSVYHSKVDTKKDIKEKEITSNLEVDTSHEISLENKYTISNIKRSILYIFVFILIIFVLYFLEQKFQYLGVLSNNLISFLIK